MSVLRSYYLIYQSPALLFISVLFFFNDTATTEIYTLSLHDALPISKLQYYHACSAQSVESDTYDRLSRSIARRVLIRSEEHTSELQSRLHLVCRLLLEKKKKQQLLLKYPCKVL